MAINPLDSLDADELFMLGMRFSTRGDSASAIGYFKLAVSASSSHAKAHWALATEYAALKMPERAEQHFAQALELDPSQAVARFQYGLLLLTGARVEEAQAVWQPLDAVPGIEAIQLFKQGLLQMVRDEFDAARASLQMALDAPSLDPAMAQDIQMAIHRIDAALKQGSESTPADRKLASAPAVESAEGHLALSAYRVGGGDSGSSH